MKIKKIFAVFLIAFFVLVALPSCKTIQNGDGTKQVVEAAGKVTEAELNVAENTDKKMESIGEFSYGTSLALNNIYSLPEFESLPMTFKLSLDAAVLTNNFVRELSPAPNSQKMLEMEEFIKKLTSELESERRSALNQSLIYENNITELNKQSAELQIKLDQAEKSFKELTFSLGEKVDTLSTSLADEKSKTTDLNGKLDKFDEGFGWYAIKHGIGIFLKKIMWITIGLGVTFLVLKILASSNPIAASIFSVFESIIGFFIKGIFSLFPKAVKFSGNIDLPTFEKVRSSRDKLVDTIESLYRIEQATPGKVYTLSEVFDELEKNMDESDKEEVKVALKKLGWGS